MKTLCLSAAGTEGALLTLVAAAAPLVSDGHKRREPQRSQGAEQRVLTASPLPPACARTANSLLLPRPRGCQVRAKPAVL